MKTIIFYSSTYNGNTLKIAESMAAALSADLVPIEAKISDIDLSVRFNRLRLGHTFCRAYYPVTAFCFRIALTGKAGLYIFYPLPSVLRQLSQSTERSSKATKG